VEDAPGALWKRDTIEKGRILKVEGLPRLVIGVDPSITSQGDYAGIIAAGELSGELYVMGDNSIQSSPLGWATEAVTAYHRHKADRVIAESNQGGEMVAQTIHTVDPSVPVTLVHATRGKYVRAEPIAALYEQGKGHHVGRFPMLEDEMCMWSPGEDSPNRMDALVWAASYLMQVGDAQAVANPFYN
jgi:phage terminase large subunit-like protein